MEGASYVLKFPNTEVIETFEKIIENELEETDDPTIHQFGVDLQRSFKDPKPDVGKFAAVFDEFLVYRRLDSYLPYISRERKGYMKAWLEILLKKGLESLNKGEKKNAFYNAQRITSVGQQKT